MEGGWGGEPKAGQSTHSDSKSSAVASVSDLNWYNPQGRPRLPGTPCSPIDAPQDHEMHLHGFTASEKPSVKADLAIYCQVLGVSG